VICTPDKDLGQCVGGKVVQLDRRKSEIRDADGVREKFGVGPASIPDFLALVGDTADGFPGIKGWGAKSTATVLEAAQRATRRRPGRSARSQARPRPKGRNAPLLQRFAGRSRRVAPVRREDVGRCPDRISCRGYALVEEPRRKA